MNASHAELARAIGRLAVEALMAEVALFPKPGLVTPFSTGAHSDMDFASFVASASALGPCFEACAGAGAARGPGLSLEDLRPIGLAGERSMLRATGGVNTHKGAIFCLGLLSAALACELERGATRLGDGACERTSVICSGLVERELASAVVHPPRTAGERLFHASGLRGARGQAEDGYPLLRKRLLPLLRRAHHEGAARYSMACLDALLLSMTELDDSCLLARGGAAALSLVQRGADEVLALGGTASERGMLALRELDRRLCAAGLSPGGSADLVAAGIFLVEAEVRLAALAARPCHALRTA